MDPSSTDPQQECIADIRQSLTTILGSLIIDPQDFMREPSPPPPMPPSVRNQRDSPVEFPQANQYAAVRTNSSPIRYPRRDSPVQSRVRHHRNTPHLHPILSPTSNKSSPTVSPVHPNQERQIVHLFKQLEERLAHKSLARDEKIRMQTVLNQTVRVLDTVAPQTEGKKEPIYKRVSGALKLFKEQNPTIHKILICILIGLTLPIVMPAIGALALF